MVSALNTKQIHPSVSSFTMEKKAKKKLHIRSYTTDGINIKI